MGSVTKGKRSTRLTPRVQKRICAFVRAGASIKIACPAAGIPWNTGKEWLAKGRAGLEPYASFGEAIAEAKAAWAAYMVQRISAASGDDWRAAAYLLERRVPGFYKPQQPHQAGEHGERVILLYPVPMPLGAEPQSLVLLPGQRFERDAGE